MRNVSLGDVELSSGGGGHIEVSTLRVEKGKRHCSRDCLRDISLANARQSSTQHMDTP